MAGMSSPVSGGSSIDGLPPVCILAGGLGTRLGTRVRDVPKPLLDVAGEPFLIHQLRLLATHGAREVVLCVGYRGEMIVERIGEERFGVRIAYSFDAPDLDGTLGAVRRALPLLGERFLVLYGDSYLRIDYAAADQAWRGSGLPALMTVLRNDGRWDISNAVYERGRVVAYDKHAPTSAMRWIDYGLGGLRACAVEAAPEGERDLAILYGRLARRGELCGVAATKRFYEIGTPAALYETDAFLRTAPPNTARGAARRGQRLPMRPGMSESAATSWRPLHATRRILRDIRSPKSGLLGQGLRFVLSGGFVALVYLTTTTLLHSELAVPFQIALAIGFALGMVFHFTLQRLFVWRHPGQFALPAHRQVARYLLVAGTQYGVTALSTARLPGLLGVPVEVVYLTTILIVTSINFVVFRGRIFHAGPAREHDGVNCATARAEDPGYVLSGCEQGPEEPGAIRRAGPAGYALRDVGRSDRGMRRHHARESLAQLLGGGGRAGPDALDGRSARLGEGAAVVEDIDTGLGLARGVDEPPQDVG